jgi:hypothetical protein
MVGADLCHEEVSGELPGLLMLVNSTIDAQENGCRNEEVCGDQNDTKVRLPVVGDAAILLQR